MSENVSNYRRLRIAGRSVAAKAHARENEAPLHRNQKEEEPVHDARAQSRVPSSAEDRDDRLKDRPRRFRIEEQIAKLRRIESDDEPAECLIALSLTFRKGRE